MECDVIRKIILEQLWARDHLMHMRIISVNFCSAFFMYTMSGSSWLYQEPQWRGHNKKYLCLMTKLPVQDLMMQWQLKTWRIPPLRLNYQQSTSYQKLCRSDVKFKHCWPKTLYVTRNTMFLVKRKLLSHQEAKFKAHVTGKVKLARELWKLWGIMASGFVSCARC